MLWAPAGDRFITGGRDSALKTWPRTGGVKPAKFEDGVGKVVALALVTVHNRVRLAVCSEDNAVRFVELQEDGRFGEMVARVYGATDRAKNELSQNDPRRREKALGELAEWKDAASRHKRPLEDLSADAHSLIAQIPQSATASDELADLRRQYLRRQLQSLDARVQMLKGTHLTFDDESRALYDATAPEHSSSDFEQVLRELEALFRKVGFRTVEAYPRFRGRYLRMPLAVIKSFEWLFGLLPYSIRKRIGRKPIIQNMLQVSLRATK